MKWLLIVATVWYWWRVYSLSFNPNDFPDPKYASAVWGRRATHSFFLGASIVTAFLYVLGAIHAWWTVAITYAICFVGIGFIQPILAGFLISLRAVVGSRRVKAGLEPHSPRLAQFAWTYYMTEEEKRKAKPDSGN